MNDGSNEWDAVSTSITGVFDSGRTPSSHGDLRWRVNGIMGLDDWISPLVICIIKIKFAESL
jgi:hypothetical protein